MLKRAIQFLLGLNAASIIRGLRLGFPEFVHGCFASINSTHPFQARSDNRVKRELAEIPELSVDEILGTRKTHIRLNVREYEDGMLPIRDAIALLAVMRVENPMEVLEIGTFMGHTTNAMAENLPDSLIHTIDLPPEFSLEQDQSDLPKDDFKGKATERRIRQHFGDTATFDFQGLGHPTFFFIDGSHTYEYCKQDSEKCLDVCGGTGTFMWHDCDSAHPGVVKFINEWRSDGRDVLRIVGTSLAYWKCK